jgi:predicted glycosyltransferase
VNPRLERNGRFDRASISGRFLFYSHDGLGLGHLRRNLAIAAGLTDAAPNASVLLATGCNELGAHGLAPNVDVLVLPGLRKLGNGRYSARRLPMSGGEMRSLRSAQLESAVQWFRPDVMLVDKHPVGIQGELRPALESLLDSGGHAVLGMRDILDDPATVAAEWSAGGVIEQIERYYDRVLVYGAPSVLDLVREYGLPASVAERSRYCGYVVHPGSTQSEAVDALPGFATRIASRPTVLATAGGGEDGWNLLESFVQAAHGAPWDGVIVTGPQLSDSRRHALRRMAIEAGVEFHSTVQGVSSWFSHVDALVCMGGYNTLCEAASRGTPTVCVPRAQPRREQLIRARAFARFGLLRMLEPEHLDPNALAHEVAAAIGGDRAATAARAEATLGFGGARRAASELLRLVSRRAVAGGRQARLAALPGP